MKARLTKRLDVSVTPGLHETIKKEALRRHRTLPDTVRTLLLEALGVQAPPIIPDDGREEFEISLTPKEVARLEKLGYNVEAFSVISAHEQLKLL